ncbi:hypothetical protein CDCA_CDCA06G1828 [Cyanidium caldarium]|uniref:Uncharacterized protein n=1 Tax=Cyanidium caldarium TaxID=2771 RepID=A0AAV9IVF1_CYACA|nr:hypothetical protein CDCA_CDCA06G1828 [Cyanidium caldarium]
MGTVCSQTSESHSVVPRRRKRKKLAPALQARTGVVSLADAGLDAMPPGLLLMNGAPVRRMVLRGNALKELGEEFGAKFRELEVLDVSKNRLQRLPASLFIECHRLRQVQAAMNRLTDDGMTWSAGDESPVPSLRWLSLSRNAFTQVPSMLSSLPFQALRFLDLTHNRIESLPKWLGAALPELEVLLLQHNALRELDVDALAGLTHLRELRVDGNRLERLPPTLFLTLPALQTFTFSGNAPHLSESPTSAVRALPGFAAFEQRRADVQNRRLHAGLA